MKTFFRLIWIILLYATFSNDKFRPSCCVSNWADQILTNFGQTLTGGVKLVIVISLLICFFRFIFMKVYKHGKDKWAVTIGLIYILMGGYSIFSFAYIEYYGLISLPLRLICMLASASLFTMGCKIIIRVSKNIKLCKTISFLADLAILSVFIFITLELLYWAESFSTVLTNLLQWISSELFGEPSILLALGLLLITTVLVNFLWRKIIIVHFFQASSNWTLVVGTIALYIVWGKIGYYILETFNDFKYLFGVFVFIMLIGLFIAMCCVNIRMWRCPNCHISYEGLSCLEVLDGGIESSTHYKRYYTGVDRSYRADGNIERKTEHYQTHRITQHRQINHNCMHCDNCGYRWVVTTSQSQGSTSMPYYKEKETTRYGDD